jgi:sugar phosphate isomerase/epimerase
MAPKLVHIHLSNNAMDGRDGHLELDEGTLPIDRFLDELRRTGYAGVISLELSVRKYLQKPKELVEMLGRNKRYVEQRLAAKGKATKGMPRRTG